MKYIQTNFSNGKDERKALTYMGVIFSLIVLSIFSFSLVQAEDFGYNYLEEGKDLNPALNYSTLNVNDSQFFNGYSIASLWTLYETYVLGLSKWDDYLLLAGGIMSGDIDMDGNDILNSGYVNGVNISNLENDYLKINQSTFQTITDGIPRLEETRIIDSEHQLVDKYYVDSQVTSIGARYYMNDTDSGTEDYKLTQITPSENAEANDNHADVVNDEYLRGWISPSAGIPTKLITGIYDWVVYAQQTGGTGKKDLRLYWELIERKADNSEVVIATSENSNLIGTAKAKYDIFIALSEDYEIASDSYVVGKIYADVSGSGGDPSVTLFYEGDSDSHWEIPTNLEILRDTFYTQTEIDNNLSNYWRSDDISESGNYYTSGNLTASNIYNKTEVDNKDYWTKTGTLLTTKTANDDVRVDGTIGIGTAPNSIHNIVTNKTLGAGGSMFAGTSRTTAGESGSGISGFVIPSTGTYTGKSFSGLDFGVFAYLTSVGGAPKSTGINVFGFGNYGGTQTIGTIKGINIEGIRRIGGTLNATDYYGIDMPDIPAFTSLTNQYQLNIGNPTRGTNNYQVILQGNGAGSGIWYGGTSGHRIYNDGTNLVFNTTGQLGYFTNNVSATGFVTRTSMLDAETKPTDYIKDRTYYLDTKGDIDHSKFYGYTQFEVTDTSRPVIVQVPKENCTYTIKKGYKEEDLPTLKNEKEALLYYDKTCSMILVDEVTYPFTKLEEGVNLEYEINVLRQEVYNLRQELNALKVERL